MRIRSVKAIGFGPLQNQVIHFSDGMTIFAGGNESAKSSWHAAILAAICGQRRGAGRTLAQKEFERSHRPWLPGDWATTAEILLDDGRNIQLRQDFSDKAGCKALDLDLARDLTDEIINDGAPDASRWLGMTRTSFVATACVRQGEILAVKDPGSGLRELLQRSSGEKGPAAAGAISLIKEFKDRAVGSDRAGSDKPLARAKAAEKAARDHLVAAEADNETYLAQLQAAREARVRCEAEEANLAVLRAAVMAERARLARERAEEARILSATIEALPDDDGAELSRRLQGVEQVLGSWRNQSTSAPEILDGQSAEEIEAELAALAAHPDGDTEPDVDVTAAASELSETRMRLETWTQQEPPRPDPPISVSPAELRNLATLLAEADPSKVTQLEAEVDKARNHLATSRRRLATAAVAVLVALGLSILAAVMFDATRTTVGIIAAVLAAASWTTAGWTALRAGTSGASDAAARAETRLEAAIQRRRLGEEAARRCADLGLQASAEALLGLADAATNQESHKRHYDNWKAERQRLEDRAAHARAGLREALAKRGALPNEEIPVEDALSCYLRSCEANAATAMEAAKAEPLRRALENRRKVEEATRRQQIRVEEAARAVLDLAGIQADGGDLVALANDAADSLEQLRSDYQQRAKALGQRDDARARLETLVRNTTVEGLADIADRLETDAADAKQATSDIGNDPSWEGEAGGLMEMEARLANLDARVADLRVERDHAQGALEGHMAHLSDVAEAEERLASATESLKGIEALKEALDTTRDLLGQAEADLNRQLAPELSESASERIGSLTKGRYQKVIVDPATLQATVLFEDGSDRLAEQLSYGTAEQIYLLLRLALVEYLSKGRDTCPVILDDVTVHADEERSKGILSLLHRISAERQVILFSQEETVKRWAEEHLDSTRDSLVLLPQVPLAGRLTA